MAVNKQMIMDMVISEAERQGVPVDLALALVNQESGFNPNVKSKVGAIGLMQLMPDTAKSLGVNPYDISDNIKGGITYLKNALIHYNNDVDKALASYNAGFGAVDKYKGIPPYKETQNYVKAIKAGRNKYTKIVENQSQVPKDINQLPTSANNLLARMQGQTTGAATQLPNVSEIVGFKDTPQQMYERATSPQDIKNAAIQGYSTFANRGLPTTAQELMARQYGAGVQDYANAYQQQVQDINQAINQAQQSGALSQQELLGKFQAMRDLVGQDPRLQNMGYQIDPEALVRTRMYARALGQPTSGYEDAIMAKYQANIANQYGVPYEDYIQSRLANIQNNLGISQAELEYLANRAAAGDNMAKAQLSAIQTAGTAYTQGLASAGKLDQDIAKTALNAILTGDNALAEQALKTYAGADEATQARVNALLNTLLGGQTNVITQGMQSDTAQNVANIQGQTSRDVANINQEVNRFKAPYEVGTEQAKEQQALSGAALNYALMNRPSEEAIINTNPNYQIQPNTVPTQGINQGLFNNVKFNFGNF